MSLWFWLLKGRGRLRLYGLREKKMVGVGGSRVDRLVDFFFSCVEEADLILSFRCVGIVEFWFLFCVVGFGNFIV